MGKSIDLTLVVPVYNSGLILPKLYNRIIKVCLEQDWSFEIIFVEDNGYDDSWVVIKKIASSDSRVKGFKLSKNYGQHNALLCGIRNATGKIIVTLDDDLQHAPEDIPKLLQKLDKNYDVVYGSPIEEKHGVFRNIASKITKLMLENAMGVKSATNISAFRAFKTNLRQSFCDYKSPVVNIDVLLSWATNAFGSVKLNHNQREIGNSGYTSGKLIGFALTMITGFSTKPLKLASLIGFLAALFGFGILIYIVFFYFWQGISVPGFFFLASIISIFSGVQLIVIGIFGEYLARMHARVMDQPQYIVQTKIKKKKFEL